MTLPVDFEKLWKEELKNREGNYNLRIIDDEVEKEFWHEFMKKRQSYAQDPWAVPIWEEARRILNCHQPETVLEIGPGWGNFTMNLVETYPDLTCLDISPDVLNFIKKVIQKEKGLQIKTVCSKWEDFEVTKPYDAVFGYNCFYRMLDLKQCIEKMNKAARKICMMGMGTGERRIYIYFINLLFQLGIAADVRVIPLYETSGRTSSLESQPGILVYWKPVSSLEKSTDRDWEICDI